MRQILLSLVLITLSFPIFAKEGPKALKNLPVQDGGRVKPFDTFARETLKLVYGKSKYKKRAASDVVLTWMLIPEHWDQTEFIQIRHSGLREALKLDKVRIFYAPKELFLNDRVGLLFQELRTKRGSGEKLNPYYQALQTLENQLTLYHAVKLGAAMRVVPHPTDDGWQTVKDLEGDLKTRFENITRSFTSMVSAVSRKNKDEEKAASGELKSAVLKFQELAKAVRPTEYANVTKIMAEVHLNEFHPFMWSWVLYLLGAIFLFAAWHSEKKYWYILGWFGVGLGLILHTYGMGLRVFLLGRPPVSNMYETVVFVPYGTVLFAMVFEKLYKNRLSLMMAAIVSTFCLILTDLAPTVLDKSLQPLEPVLRDNFWLLTHVLVITISYGAFFLAFAIGDLLLFYYLRGEEKYKDKIQQGCQAIYRSVQIGILLLGAGIILGGVWADYSWGRFWGWDPKETWALIAWLGYLAILHGRLVGWIKNFGLAVGSVVAFSLVIMAWYGVNFVLGAGLHSYGFGAGGVEYVSGFVAVHLLFVVYVASVRHSRMKNKETTKS